MKHNVEKLRLKHSEFIYDSFKYSFENNDISIVFNFRIKPNIAFSPRIVIHDAVKNINNLDREIIDNLIFHLGLIESLSYWKATCSPIIKIKAAKLTDSQIAWWKILIINGMGEYFFKNDIDFTKKDFLSIISSSKNSFKAKEINQINTSYVTMVGGGKDSIVSIEMLKQAELNQQLMILNQTSASKRIVKTSDINGSIKITRIIDPNLLKLNKSGYLNGHTPFSAYLAFLGILLAVIYKGKYIIASNERSSDEENLYFKGEKINHQYSKTISFERAFRNYSSTFITPSVTYFSLLRPLWEIQISKIFSDYPKYHNIFISCNIGQKQNLWCCECPKCFSVFILLYPFLGKRTKSIFSRNLYEDESLKPLLLQLAGIEKPKPFECVGTTEEIKAGLYLSIKKSRQISESIPSLLKYSQQNILANEKNMKSRTNTLLQGWGEDKFIPMKIKRVLKEISNGR